MIKDLSMPIQQIRETAVESLLMTVGEDPTREGLKDTPKRVAKMYNEIFAGYEMDPKAILNTTFCEDDVVSKYNNMVIVKDIEFYSHCEHHMVPFFGKIHVGYVPQDKVVGISKIARLVECYAKRLQIQERLGDQIMNMLSKELGNVGVAVYVEAKHLCMSMRGVKNTSANTVTFHVNDNFDRSIKDDFLRIIGVK